VAVAHDVPDVLTWLSRLRQGQEDGKLGLCRASEAARRALLPLFFYAWRPCGGAAVRPITDNCIAMSHSHSPTSTWAISDPCLPSGYPPAWAFCWVPQQPMPIRDWSELCTIRLWHNLERPTSYSRLHLLPTGTSSEVVEKSSAVVEIKPRRNLGPAYPSESCDGAYAQYMVSIGSNY
jgi:hypothetical protein